MTSLHPSHRIASSAIQIFNQAGSAADQIISELPGMQDEELLEIRQRARAYGRMAWRVECACDAEILNRQSQRRGPGVKDEEQKGVDAAVKKHAAQIGVHPQTIYRNAKLHRTYFNSSTSARNKGQSVGYDELEEKDFYLLGMETDDPIATIEDFAQEKARNPGFSPRDASRKLKERKTPPLDETVPALCDEPEVVAKWELFQAACHSLVRAAPRLQGLVNGYLEEIQYELTVPSQTVEQTIYDIIRQGYDEADMIAQRMKKDRIHVIVWLNRLCELGKLESFEKERAPGARGAARTGYREI